MASRWRYIIIGLLISGITYGQRITGITASSINPAYYVSEEGSDGSNGKTMETSWQTLDKVQTEITANNIEAGDKILFKSGEEFEGELDLETTNNLSLGTYGGTDNAIFTGLTDISGSWFSKGSNIYSKEVTSTDIKYLFVDDVSYLVGRYPNVYHDFATAPLGPDLNESTCVNSGSLPYASFSNATATGFDATCSGAGDYLCGTAQEISVTDGDEFTVTFDLVLNSGQLPSVSLEGGFGGGPITEEGRQAASSGSNEFELTADGTDNCVFQFYNTASADFEITNLSVKDNAGGTISTTAIIGTDSLIQADDYWNGGEVVARVNDWWYDMASITDYVQSTKTLTISPALYSAVPVGNGYYIVNHENCLDTKGEWAFDGDSVYLYWASDPSSLDIKASIYDNAIEFKGDNITLNNLSIRGYNNAGIYSTNNDASGLTAYYDSIDYCAYGYSLDSVNSAKIYYNSLTEIGHVGNWLYNCDTLEFYSNLIKNVGINPTYGVRGGEAFYSIDCDKAEIYYNDIDSIGYLGIQTDLGNETVVHGNRIRNYCLTTYDGGGIYAYNTDDSHKTGYNGQTWSHNLVFSDSDSLTGGTAWTGDYKPFIIGLYADNYSSEITMRNNVVVGNFRNFFTNWGDDLTIDSCWLAKSWGVYGNGWDSVEYNAVEIQTQAVWGGTDATDSTENFTVTDNYIVTNWQPHYYQNTWPYFMYVRPEGTQIDIDGNYILMATGTQETPDHSTFVSQFNATNKTITTWNATAGVGTDVLGTPMWSDSWTNTTRDEHVVYDYNFSAVARNFVMEAGWTYYEIDGTEASSYSLDPYTGAILLRVNDLDLP